MCVCVCGPRLPLFLGAQSMLGQRGSVSMTSPSGACLELAQPRCAQCVCVCVFLKGKTLQAVTVPETLTNKLICVPLLPNSIYTQQPYTSPDFGAAFKHNVPFAPSAEGTEDSSSYFHPPSCTVFLSLPGTAIHTVCLSPPPTQRCRLQALCCVVSAWPRL